MLLSKVWDCRAGRVVRSRWRVGTAGLVLCSAVNVTHAADLDWTQTTGPLLYDTAANWTPAQAPTNADNVTFSIAIAPTPDIILGALSQGNDVNILDNDWVFTGDPGANLDTQGTLTIDDALGTTLADGANLTVNAAANWDNAGNAIIGSAGYGSLTLEAGANLSANHVTLGDLTNGHGKITVDAAGSLLQAAALFIGNGNTNTSGTLDIKNGAAVSTTGEAQIASNASAFGIVLVTGLGSTFDVGTTLSLGDNAPNTGTANGIMLVSNGAAVSNNANAYIGRFTGATGNVNLSSATADLSTWNVGGDLILAGDETSSQLTGSGTLGVLNGSRLTVQGSLRIRNLGSVALNGGTIHAADIELVDLGADFTWNAGTVRFINTPTYELSQTLLEGILTSATPTLAAPQHLIADNTALLTSSLRLHGGTLSVGDFSPASAANLDFDTGTFNLTSADLLIGTAGTFGDNLTLDTGQTLNVTNHATIEPDANLTVIGNFTANSLTNQGHLTLINAATASSKNFAPTLITPAGSTVTLVGDTTFTSNVSGAGNFFGPGNATFADGYNPNDPAAPPADVTFESGFLLADGQSLNLQIADASPGNFSTLHADGDITLDGQLHITLLNAFAPDAGDAFQILHALGSLTGHFDTLNLPTLDPGLTWGTLTTHNTFTLAVGITGDFNNSGQVEQGDLDLVLQNWGLDTSGGIPSGWINDNLNLGQIEQTELDRVLQNWGNTHAPNFASNFRGDFRGNFRGVPEPATLALLGLGGLAMLRRRPACFFQSN